MTTKTQEPSAIELVKQDDAKVARVTEQAQQHARAEVVAKAEFNDAAERVGQTLAGVLRGDPDAESLHEGALARRSEATAQLARLEAEQTQAVALLEIRRAEAHKKQLYDGCLPEFTAQAEEVVAKCAEARERLLGPLNEYLAAYAEAEAIWQPLYPAIRSRLKTDETERGFDRTGESVTRDTSVPECPVDASVLTRIARVEPRPPCMNAGFDGNPFKASPSPADLDTGPDLVGEDGPLMFDGSN